MLVKIEIDHTVTPGKEAEFLQLLRSFDSDDRNGCGEISRKDTLLWKLILIERGHAEVLEQEYK